MIAIRVVYFFTIYAAFSMILIESALRFSFSLAATRPNLMQDRRTQSSGESTAILHTKERADVIAAAVVKAATPSTLQTLVPILAAAFCTAAIMYPLDLIRALQMSNAGAKLSTRELLSNFKKVHGITGFFTQGLAPELARSTWMRFIKFSLFPIVHQSLTGLSESQGSSLSKAVAAIISSIPEAISIMPLEMSKIALQLDSVNAFKNNMFNAMASVYRDRGLQGFNVGYLGVQYRQAAWSAGYFASLPFFEAKVKSLIAAVGMGYFEAAHPDSTKMFNTLFSGFLAGVFGACLNTPGDTIRTIIQKRVLSSGASSAPALGALQIGREIYAARGIGGLYAGFGFKAFHLGGGGALMAFFVPFFKALLEKKFPTDSTK